MSALENAIRPRAGERIGAGNEVGRRWEDAAFAARENAIDAFHDQEVIAKYPDVAQERQQQRDRLNAFLVRHGFAPEPRAWHRRI